MSLTTTLTDAITADTATLVLASVAGVIPNDLLTIEDETVQVLQVGPGTSLIVSRGVSGSAAAVHAAGVAVVSAGSAAEPAVESLFHQGTRLLTNDEIKNLPTTAIEIVASPGPDLALLPINVALVITMPLSIGYTGINTDFADLYLAHGAGQTCLTGGLVNRATPSITTLSNFLSNAGWAMLLCGGAQNIGAVSSVLGLAAFHWEALPDDKPLTLMGYDDSAGAWTGHADCATNTLRVSVNYSILNLTTGRFV